MSARKYNPVTPVLFLAGGSAVLAVGVILQGRLRASPWPWAEYVIFGIAYLLAGWNVLAGAVRSIGRGRVFDENFLMTVATAGAFAVHQLWEAVAVMVFYKVGEILEDLSVDRSRRSISKLLTLRPDAARVRRGGALIEVKPEQVAVGEEVLVRPGERVPLDGVVLTRRGVRGYLRTDGRAGAAGSWSPARRCLPGSSALTDRFPSAPRRPRVNPAPPRSFPWWRVRPSPRRRRSASSGGSPKVYTPLVVAAAAGVAFVPPLVFRSLPA